MIINMHFESILKSNSTRHVVIVAIALFLPMSVHAAEMRQEITQDLTGKKISSKILENTFLQRDLEKLVLVNAVISKKKLKILIDLIGKHEKITKVDLTGVKISINKYNILINGPEEFTGEKRKVNINFYYRDTRAKSNKYNATLIVMDKQSIGVCIKFDSMTAETWECKNRTIVQEPKVTRQKSLFF